MFKKHLFWETIFFLIIVGVMNIIAVKNNLYWSTSEFDSLMHFLAGVFVSFFFLWFYFFSGFFKPPKRNFLQFLLVSLLGILFIGVAWETYELILGESLFSGENYISDTVLDFIMDFLGAIVGCFYGYIRELKSLKDTI